MNRKLIGGLVGVNFLLFLCICNFLLSTFDIAKSKENIQSGDGGGDNYYLSRCCGCGSE